MSNEYVLEVYLVKKPYHENKSKSIYAALDWDGKDIARACDWLKHKAIPDLLIENKAYDGKPYGKPSICFNLSNFYLLTLEEQTQLIAKSMDELSSLLKLFRNCRHSDLVAPANFIYEALLKEGRKFKEAAGIL